MIQGNLALDAFLEIEFEFVGAKNAHDLFHNGFNFPVCGWVVSVGVLLNQLFELLTLQTRFCQRMF